MADTSRGKVASPVADDDPFAELTRIMGFDPREPVARANTGPATSAASQPQRELSQPEQHHAAPAAADDLELDLERELLGEFADDPAQHGAWEVVADHAEHPEVEPYVQASGDEWSEAEAWSSQPESEVAARHVEEQPAYDAYDAQVDAVSHMDWEVDLAADLLSGVESSAHAEREDDRAEASYRTEAAAVHYEPAPQAAPSARAQAPRDQFASDVDLPPIPLSRSAEPIAGAEPVAVTEPVAAVAHEDHDDASLELALEHELGAALSDPVDDMGWEDLASGWHADDNHQASLSAAVDEASEPVVRYEEYAEPVEVAASGSHEQPADRDGVDPYAALAALTAGALGSPHRPQVASVEYATAAAESPVASEVPDIETVEVPERGVPVAEEFDIPEIQFDEPQPAASAYDDIDAEFANLLNEMNSFDRSTPAATSASSWQSANPVAAQQEQPVVAPAAAAAPEAGTRYAVDADYLDPARGEVDTDLADMEFAFDPDDTEEMAPAALVASRPRNRGYMIAAALAGVAVLGGLAAFTLPFGGSEESSEIALVEADPSPTKVRPENRGGVVIPNQDNKVYERVAGAGDDTPAQEKLVQSDEEPLELPMPRDEDAADLAPFPGDVEGVIADASPKGEERIVPQEADGGVDTTMEVAAVPPRKVRTMVVKADGSLVAREVPAEDASVSAEDGAVEVDPIASATTAADEDASLPVDEPLAQPPTAKQAAPAPAATEAPAATTAAKPTPKAAPIAPNRPSDQPLDIVGEVPSTQVAALDPAAAGGWSMQIASQPNEAAAQASFRDLQRRYAGVLGDRQANIVKADIPGKGTFWRVRVPAGSRAEAVKLCESYKAAGGSCFVSK